MATAPEKLVCEMLASRLGVTFETSHLKVDDWGYADGWFILPNQMWLVVEMEAQQKHPTTNVLKYWPYLEAHEDQTILLAHCFFPASPGLNSSRGKLAGWLGARLEQIFDGRFFYQRLVVTETGEPSEGFRELQERIKRTS